MRAVPGSGFWVPGWVPGSNVRSRFQVPDRVPGSGFRVRFGVRSSSAAGRVCAMLSGEGDTVRRADVRESLGQDAENVAEPGPSHHRARNLERGTWNQRGTRNPERTRNPEPNPEPRTRNPEPGIPPVSSLQQRVGLLVGVVRAAHQRARLDVTETHLEGKPLQLGELRGRVVAVHDGGAIRSVAGTGRS